MRLSLLDHENLGAVHRDCDSGHKNEAEHDLLGED
jgi:hypothetical protein